MYEINHERPMEYSREPAPEEYDLGWWLDEVSGWTASRFPSPAPARLREDGPLRQALLAEFLLLSACAAKASRALAALVVVAPDGACLEFYSTQLLDEVRHRRMYRAHLLEIGFSEQELDETGRTQVAARSVLPFAKGCAWEETMDGDFYRGVLALTVLAASTITSITGLSERKWRALGPVAARIQASVNRDRQRLLDVGRTVIGRRLRTHPGDRRRLMDLVWSGREFCPSDPLFEALSAQEELFQEGMERFASLVPGYELWPGRLILATTADDRVSAARQNTEALRDLWLSDLLLDG